MEKKTFIINPKFRDELIALNPDLHWVDSGCIEIEPHRKGEIPISEEKIIEIALKLNESYEASMNLALEPHNEWLYDEMENYLAPSHCNLIASLCFHAGLAIEG
jgi:hypothetical protein